MNLQSMFVAKFQTDFVRIAVELSESCRYRKLASIKELG